MATSIAARSELTLAQTAVALECSERSVGRYIKSGLLHTVHRGGRRLVPRQALRDFLRCTVELDRQIAARGGDIQDLKEWTGLDEDAINRARRGEDSAALRQIAKALRGRPVDRLLAAIVGVDAQEDQQ